MCSVQIVWFAEDPFNGCAIQTQVVPPAVNVLDDVAPVSLFTTVT